MRDYVGTKFIKAEPAIKKGGIVYRYGDPIPKSLDKVEEGYKVQYVDGYVSWSPKEAFEKAYRAIDGLTFGIAVELLKQGHKVARKGWNGKNMWLKLVQKGYFDVGISIVEEGCEGLLPWIGMRTADGKFVPWLASQTDVLAEDWVIL